MPRLTARPLRRRRLGCLPDVPDDRDLPLAAPSAIPELTEPIDFRPDSPRVVDQGPTSSCVGHAFKAAFEIKESMLGLPHVPLSALHPYYHSRRAHQPRGLLFDAGTYIRGAARVVRKLGIAPEDQWPFDRLLWRVGRRPPPRVDIAGFERSGGTFRRVLDEGDAKIAAVVGALQDDDPVIFGTRVSKRFQRNDGPLIVHPPEPDEPIAGGHAMVIVGARRSTVTGELEFLVRNSWSENWREGGHAWLTESYVRWSHLRDLTVVRGWHRMKEAT